MRIKTIKARQILNGRGHPTLEVEVQSSKNTAVASIPIAVSKSRYEFYDVYDNDLSKFNGETLEVVIKNIEEIIQPELVGKNSMDQEEIDNILLKLDGTLERTKLGVNTITAISKAIAKLGSKESDLPLFKYIRVLHDYTGSPSIKLNSDYLLPKPVVTILRSSSHNRDANLPFQEIFLLPEKSFKYRKDLLSFFNCIRTMHLKDHHSSFVDLLEDLNTNISKSKFKTLMGIDMAASKYKRAEGDGEHHHYVLPKLHSPKVNFNGNFNKLFQKYIEIISKYDRLVFLEDLFSEDDFSAWKMLNDHYIKHNANVESNKNGRRVEVVADDLTSTNTERLEKAATLECCNHVIIKPSQIGTITESIQFTQLARKLGLDVSVSYRYGETEDTFISDFATGVNAMYIRAGYKHGSEYLSKLNRLSRIESSIM